MPGYEYEQNTNLSNLGIQNGDICGENADDDLESPDPEFPKGCNPLPDEQKCKENDLPVINPVVPVISTCGEFTPDEEQEQKEEELDEELTPIAPCDDEPYNECENDPSKCEEPEDAMDVDDISDEALPEDDGVNEVDEAKDDPIPDVEGNPVTVTNERPQPEGEPVTNKPKPNPPEEDLSETEIDEWWEENFNDVSDVQIDGPGDPGIPEEDDPVVPEKDPVIEEQPLFPDNDPLNIEEEDPELPAEDPDGIKDDPDIPVEVQDPIEVVQNIRDIINGMPWMDDEDKDPIPGVNEEIVVPGTTPAGVNERPEENEEQEAEKPEDVNHQNDNPFGDADNDGDFNYLDPDWLGGFSKPGVEYLPDNNPGGDNDKDHVVNVQDSDWLGDLSKPGLESPLEPVTEPEVSGIKEPNKPAIEFLNTEAAGKRFAFILDCSGSMVWGLEKEVVVPIPLRRWTVLCQKVMLSLEQLPDDSETFISVFSGPLVDYNSTPHPRHMQVGSFSATWVKTNAESKTAIKAWLEKVYCDGSTEPTPAIKLTMGVSPEPDAIFFLSDGEFTETGVVAYWRKKNIMERKKAGKLPIKVHTFTVVDDKAASDMRQICGDVNAGLGLTRWWKPGHTGCRYQHVDYNDLSDLPLS